MNILDIHKVDEVFQMKCGMKQPALEFQFSDSRSQVPDRFVIPSLLFIQPKFLPRSRFSLLAKRGLHCNYGAVIII